MRKYEPRTAPVQLPAVSRKVPLIVSPPVWVPALVGAAVRLCCPGRAGSGTDGGATWARTGPATRRHAPNALAKAAALRRWTRLVSVGADMALLTSWRKGPASAAGPGLTSGATERVEGNAAQLAPRVVH